ncbi:tripartite-type tricarboxylate transporter receptor subunit TctC [Variovorax sp. 1140]|uniref:tripartite tricarboxylate transporter substrate-binding protein n=1 Tax=Variovorax atrisoli TaxID=3394203 RepID=UPI00339B9366
MKKTPAPAVHLALTLALGLAAATGAQAQDFPGGKPITIVVPFAAGGPTDRVARDLAEAMRKPLDGTSIVIDNAAGAGSTIGNAKVARARPDGYTLLLTHAGMATTPVLYRKLPYNYETDFEYLGMINDVPMTVIGKPQLQARSFGELREWIAKNPGKTNLGNAGIGSASHLCGLLLQSELKAEMTTVPYKGTAPAIADLLGGQIDLLCDQTTNTTSQIEAGKVKAYGVTTLKRLGTPALKDLPTLDESGLKNFQVTIWHGLYAPKGTPAPVLRKLNDALKAALKDPEFVKKEEGLGAVVVADRRVEPAEHRKFVQQEVARFGPVVKAAGVYAD